MAKLGDMHVQPRRKRKAPRIISAIAVALVLAAIGYWIYQKGYFTPAPPSPVPDSQLPAPTAPAPR